MECRYLHDFSFNKTFYCTWFCLTPNNHSKPLQTTSPLANFPSFRFSLSLSKFFPSLATHEVMPMSYEACLSHFNTWTLGTSYLSLLAASVSGIHSSLHTNSGGEGEIKQKTKRDRDRGSLSFLTKASGVKWSVSLALPLPSAVACAQTLEQVALAVCFSPGISNAIGGQSILVVTAI